MAYTSKDGFNNLNIKGYFNKTLQGANSVMEIRRRFGALEKPPADFTAPNHNAASGETLRRVGTEVFRMEKDGSIRGSFASE